MNCCAGVVREGPCDGANDSSYGEPAEAHTGDGPTGHMVIPPASAAASSPDHSLFLMSVISSLPFPCHVYFSCFYFQNFGLLLFLLSLSSFARIYQFFLRWWFFWVGLGWVGMADSALQCTCRSGLPDCAKSVYFVFLFIGVDFEFCAVLFKIVIGHIKVRNRSLLVKRNALSCLKYIVFNFRWLGLASFVACVEKHILFYFCFLHIYQTKIKWKDNFSCRIMVLTICKYVKTFYRSLCKWYMKTLTLSFYGMEWWNLDSVVG